jgi:hypothetical protein
MTSEPWQLPDPPPGQADDGESVNIGREDAVEYAEENGVDGAPDHVSDQVETQERIEPPD